MASSSSSIVDFSTGEVASWLENNGMANNVVENVLNEGINGQLLLDVEEQDLACLAPTLKDRIPLKNLLRSHKV